MEDAAEFELKIKEQGARSAADNVSRLDESLKRAQRSAADFNPDRHWRDQLSQLNKVAAAQDRITLAVRRREEQDAAAAARRGSNSGISSAAEAGVIAGLVSGGVGLVGDALKEIGHLAVDAALEVGHLGVKFAEASLEAGAFAERSQLAIGFLTHNAGAAKGVFDDVRQEAQDLGLNVDETVHSFQRLLAMQFSVGQSKELVKMGGDMQAIGADAEHVQRLLYAISEIKGIGTLQQRQVRMLEMAGVSGELINEALAKRLNVTTTAQVKKLQRKGQIDAAVAIDAIEEAVMHKVGESHLGEAGAKFAQTTITGQLGAAEAKARNFMLNIGEAITPVEERIGARLGSLFDQALQNPHLAELGDKILGDLNGVADWIDGHWPEIESDFNKGVDDIVLGAQRIEAEVKDAASAVVENWDQIKATTKEVTNDIWLLAQPFIYTARAVGFLVEELWALDKALGLDKAMGFINKLTAFSLFPALALGENRGLTPEGKLEKQDSSEKEALEKNRAETLARQQALGIVPGPRVQPATIAPRNVSDLNTMFSGAQAVQANKTLNVGDIIVNVEGVKHDGSPAGAGDEAGAQIRHQVLRLLDSAS